MEGLLRSRKVKAGLRTALAGLLALSLVGCSRDKTPAVPSGSEAERGTVPAEPPANERPTELMQEAVRNYQMLLQNSKLAVVALGNCVAWSTGPNKIMVTANPGFVDYSRGLERYNMFLFSRVTPVDSTSVPRIDLDGGAFGHLAPDGRQLETFSETIVLGPPAEPTSVQAADEPVKGQDGRWSYVAADTKEPLIKTGIVEGSLTPEHVRDICLELGQHNLLPQGQTA